MEKRYRLLSVGEEIKNGDEFYVDALVWARCVDTVGACVKDPHVPIRREVESRHILFAQGQQVFVEFPHFQKGTFRRICSVSTVHLYPVRYGVFWYADDGEMLSVGNIPAEKVSVFESDPHLLVVDC